MLCAIRQLKYSVIANHKNIITNKEIAKKLYLVICFLVLNHVRIQSVSTF